MKRIRIGIADDHSVVREGLYIILKSDPRFHVKGVFSDGEELFSYLEENDLDVLILDIDIPGGEDFAILKYVKMNNPKCKVILFTMHSGMKYFLDAKSLGADSYVVKTESVTFMPTVIMYTMKGEFYASPELKEFIGKPNDKFMLNPIELEIANFISKGLNYKEIGEKLSKSEKTIEYYAGKIRKKLDVKNNSELIAVLIKQ